MKNSNGKKIYKKEYGVDKFSHSAHTYETYKWLEHAHRTDIGQFCLSSFRCFSFVFGVLNVIGLIFQVQNAARVEHNHGHISGYFTQTNVFVAVSNVCYKMTALYTYTIQCIAIVSLKIGGDSNANTVCSTSFRALQIVQRSTFTFWRSLFKQLYAQ